MRLQQRGLIEAEWGVSDNNRRARFYRLTRRGRAQLQQEAANWRALADVMGLVLAAADGGRS